MKINESKYQCDWCLNIFTAKVGRATNNGKHTTPGQVLCPICPGIRYVSQKIKSEMSRW